MCGIFGVVKKPESKVTNQQIKTVTDELLRYSVARGKESSGVAVYRDSAIDVLKIPNESLALLREAKYKERFKSKKQIRAVIGHARLVTNGDEGNANNNQPVIKDGVVGVHNGIIVNDSELWSVHNDISRSYDVDTELLLALTRKKLSSTQSHAAAVAAVLAEIQGTVSTALLFAESAVMIVATNNGSLYISDEGGLIVFASERSFLERLLKAKPWLGYGIEGIKRLDISDVGTINLLTGTLTWSDTAAAHNVPQDSPANIVDYSEANISTKKPQRTHDKNFLAAAQDIYESNRRRIATLKRCTHCILPETMPFISFNDQGVCNYCQHYKKNAYHGEDMLQEVADSIRSKNGDPDCLVTFSGGRDSSYCLHYLVKELGLNPITYSYDWGMVTDIARRNQARMCGQLGLENIVVSANLQKKRDNIRKNVTAWLKRPSLGMIPLFMAGDKQFFYYANKVQQQTNVPRIVLSINPLERTDFKSGFCGVAPNFAKRGELFYRLSGGQSATMFAFYAKEFLGNIGYLNSSLMDTAFAFSSYYMIRHDYIHLFDYIPWKEETVDDVLINEYGWEVAGDSKTTWRIGDGTAAFYNYIYYTVAGFTENDTFRSNQIREGQLHREEALSRSISENEPRFDSFVWYCNTIGIDYQATIDRIHEIPKLYGV